MMARPHLQDLLLRHDGTSAPYWVTALSFRPYMHAGIPPVHMHAGIPPAACVCSLLFVRRYGVPASGADDFEQVAFNQVYAQAMSADLAAASSHKEVQQRAWDKLLGKTTMFSPQLLMDNGEFWA